MYFTRTFAPSVRPSIAPTLVPSLVLALAMAWSLPVEVEAQLRGGGQSRPRVSGVSGYWISAGAAAAGLGPVKDGPSASQWDFGGDPRWLLRGTLEKAMGATTTIGLAASFGNVDFGYSNLEGAPVLDPMPGDTSSVTRCQSSGCTGQLDLWGLQAVLRGGGSNDGLYQVVEATAGVNSFRNLTVKSDGAALPIENTIDYNASIGYGIGFAFSSDFHVAFVQDFGIAWHRGEMLPEGTGRTYRTRNSRVTLRYGLGSWSR